MIIDIDHITINVIIQPKEPVQEVVLINETPRVQKPFKRGHRRPEEIQAKQRQLSLELVKAQQAAMQSAERLQRKLRVAEKLRAMFGDETANSVLGGAV